MHPLKRSSSLPNLRNYLTSVKCLYCCYGLERSHSQGNQSTQTSIDDDHSSNSSSNYALNVPSSERNLRHQLTKDSGIELNSSKSKSNSYSSTPIDPSDLAMISSTRNNSLDCIIDGKKAIINEISKENDVLEDSSQKYDNQLAKYNINMKLNRNTELPQSATNKRKLFKGALIL